MRNEALLSLRRLPYEDSVIRTLLYASNGYFSGTQEFYCSPEDLKTWAEALRKFPGTISDEAVFESGDADPKWAYWLKLRAYSYDSCGHSAVEVMIDNRQGSNVKFAISCDPARLNELGRTILSWTDERRETLIWKPEL